MKTKKGFSLRHLGVEFVLIPEGLEVSDANCMISMNESAAFLWKAVDGKDFDNETLIGLLMEEYGISREVAEKDVAVMVESWKQMKILED